MHPGRCGSNLKSVIPEHILRIKFVSTSWESVIGIVQDLAGVMWKQ